MILPDVVDALVDPLERRRCLAAVAHQDDALHDVRLVVVADDSEPRSVADVHVGDVSYPHRRPLLFGDDAVFDILRRRLGRAQETDAADVVRLLAHEEPVAADVLVRVLDGGSDLGKRHAVPVQAKRVDLDVVLFGLAPITRDVDDPLNLLELTLENPVFGGLQVLEGVALADQSVPVDLADGVPWRELTLNARR